MRLIRNLREDRRGTAIIELAFALPVLIIMMWVIIQLGLVFRAMSGIQHGLGEGARYATLCQSPTSAGCAAPNTTNIKNKITATVYGIGPGSFTIPTPVSGNADGANYLDLKVTYTQATDLLLLRGPTITVSRSKRVWISS